MIITCVKQYTDYMNREITSAPWILTRQGNHVIVHVSRLVSCIMYGYSIIITGSVSAHIRTESPGMWDIGYRLSVQYMMAQLYHYNDVKMGPMGPHCLLNRWFRRRSKKTSKLRVTGLCAGNSPVTGEFPAQMTSNAEKVSIWWRHHSGGTHNCLFPCWSQISAHETHYIPKYMHFFLSCLFLWC